MTNRFEGLDFVNIVPEELWREVSNIEQETVNKIIPKNKKNKKAKLLSEKASQIAEEREAKRKGEREKYTQLNAELQRIAKKDKKAFFNEQCKEIEDNNRKNNTQDHFKKIRNIKGTFHPKRGKINDRNRKDLIEAEEIKKRWKEHTELYTHTQKDLNDLDNHDGVVTHPEPNILECEVKWALGNTAAIKASGGDGIPAELFQILKDDAIKVLHQYVSKFGKPCSGRRTGKDQSSSQFPRRAVLKNVQTPGGLPSFHMLVRLKIPQARLQHM